MQRGEYLAEMHDLQIVQKEVVHSLLFLGTSKCRKKPYRDCVEYLLFYTPYSFLRRALGLHLSSLFQSKYHFFNLLTKI